MKMWIWVLSLMFSFSSFGFAEDMGEAVQQVAAVENKAVTVISSSATKTDEVKADATQALAQPEKKAERKMRSFKKEKDKKADKALKEKAQKVKDKEEEIIQEGEETLGELPPGLSKKEELPKGLAKKEKTPQGWSEGAKKGWSKEKNK